AAFLRDMLAGSGYTRASSGQSCYSLRCIPQGLGQVWEANQDGRAVIEREINSANDNALIALLVDDRFNNGLPANLTPEPGVNSGFKGMQLSITSLACAVRQMAGPSSIHSLPTEQYNQDVVSLGMHAAVTAMDALECVRNLTAMLLMAGAQAVDLRGGPQRLGRGSRRVYDAVRRVIDFEDRDRTKEREVAELAANLPG